MKISIKKLSEMTGFSPATISNALNNKKGVNNETAEKILNAAKECGYTKGKKVLNIKLVIYKESGSVVSDTPFFTHLIEGIEYEAQKNGLEVVVFNLDKHSPDYKLRLNELLADTSSAIIFLGTELSEEDAKVIKQIPAPLVMLDAWFDGTSFDTIQTNNQDSAFQAVKYLGENGHTKIGYLFGSVRIKNFTFRRYGYEKAMHSLGLVVQDKYCFGLTPNMFGAMEDMEEIIKSGAEMPTAFFADNDIIALGAIKALQTYGYKIPDDISIVGFDDMPFSQVSEPALTTVRVHKKEIGQIAVRRLIEKIDTKSSMQVKIAVNNDFVIRESVKNIR